MTLSDLGSPLGLAMTLCALVPAVLSAINERFFRRPIAPAAADHLRAAVSILIPARNEAASIAQTVQAALRSTDGQVEVIVLDDGSTDQTAQLARTAGATVVTAPELPQGWVGKPHACWVLAGLAQHDWFLFLDADVTVQPQAVSALLAEAEAQRLDICPYRWLKDCLIPRSRPDAGSSSFAAAGPTTAPGGTRPSATGCTMGSPCPDSFARPIFARGCAMRPLWPRCACLPGCAACGPG
jgi:GT2 family glycosyltransferase